MLIETVEWDRYVIWNMETGRKPECSFNSFSVFPEAGEEKNGKILKRAFDKRRKHDIVKDHAKSMEFVQMEICVKARICFRYIPVLTGV